MGDQDSRTLQAKLAEAESIIQALRAGNVDAVVGEEQVALLRLREVEDALRRSEARYRGIVEDQADLVYRWDREGRLTFVNAAVCRWLGQDRDELEGTPVGAALPAESSYREIWAELASVPDAERPSLDREDWVRTPAGEVRWLNVTHRLLYDDEGGREIQSVARDVTERRRAQQQLRELNAQLGQRVEERTAQLRRLVSELDEAEQRERRRLAQFLHDDLQQLLVASKLSLASARSHTTDDPVLTAVDRTEELLERSLAASRSLVSQLSPPKLLSSGLVPALEWLGGQMEEMHRIPVVVDGDPQVDPEATDLRDMLFSFARELLFNCIKHARASRVRLHIRRRDDDWIEIEVEDDGAGFDTQAWTRAERRESGLGLWRIDERLRLLGGQLQVDSEPNRGTRVTLTAPAAAGGDEP